MSDPRNTSATATTTPAPVGNSRIQDAEPPAPELAGAGVLYACADCGKTYKDGVALVPCSDGKRRCQKHAYQNDPVFRERCKRKSRENRKASVEAVRLQGFEECEALVVAWLEREIKKVEESAVIQSERRLAALGEVALAIRLGQHRTHEGQE